MQVSKRDRSFLRPDKRSMGNYQISKAFAFAMKDVVDTDKVITYKVKHGSSSVANSNKGRYANE